MVWLTDGQTDGRTDRQRDRRADAIPYYVQSFTSGVLKRAAKLIFNKPTRTQTAGLIKLLQIYANHKALLVYKTLYHVAPSYMSVIIIVSTNNSYSLRSVLHNDFVLKQNISTIRLIISV